ncbi:unnamed protein product [Parnassius apollo]|uniref:(apollo) hypothetical protein n=1 Tax=Parnassius apollo TaxID=110799 RepID=A0A8S3Y6S4_PARAO|nr:unnamed protein product [Parnassius apollo]
MASAEKNAQISLALCGKKKKLLEEIHPLHIIREVQKWPGLYVKNSPEQTNVNLKHKMWIGIAKALFNDWDKFSADEKECKVTDLQRKWRNLRDTFKRQIAIEKQIREGKNIKKKTYVYFKYMLFLLPHLQAAEEEEKDETVSPLLDEYLGRKRSIHPSTKARRQVMRRHANDVANESAVAEVAPRASLGTGCTIDEDEHFLMSLIPSFKKMTDDEKLTTKVEILKVIKQVRRRSERHGSERRAPASPAADILNIDDYKEELIHVETDELLQSGDEYDNAMKYDNSEESSE